MFFFFSDLNTYRTKMFKCITSLTTIIFLLTLAKSSQLNVQEGDMAQLAFQYPCNSTKVTLQRSNGAPFYSSENPDGILESNKIVSNQKDNNICSLNLTINPVSRNDKGTYIPIGYENGNIINPHEERRIWLNVDYPPGKASCESPTDYIKGEWVKLKCKASKGTVPGQMLCFQNGMRLPHLSLPQETATKVDQNILARLAYYPVYCCSSTLIEIKDRCDCTDWGWDSLNGLLSNIEPCAATSTSHSFTSSKENRVKITTHIPTYISLKAKTTNLAPAQSRYFTWDFITIIMVFGSIIAFIVVTILILNYKWDAKNEILNKNCSR